MALGGLGGEWGPQPCSSSARPQRFLNDKGQEEQPPNPPPRPKSTPQGWGGGEDEHGFPYGLTEGHFLSIARSIVPTSGAPWVDLERG